MKNLLKEKQQYVVLKEELLGWREVPVVALKDQRRAWPWLTAPLKTGTNDNARVPEIN